MIEWLVKKTKYVQKLREALGVVSNELHKQTVRADKLDRETYDLRERVNAIAERLARVSLQRRPPPHSRIRIVMELDVDMLKDTFLHGNDDLVIRGVGDHIGRMAAYELKRANFHRWEV